MAHWVLRMHGWRLVQSRDLQREKLAIKPGEAGEGSRLTRGI